MMISGRAALQKRIMALLRKLEHCVNGVQPVSAFIYIFMYFCYQWLLMLVNICYYFNIRVMGVCLICFVDYEQAWEETFRNWDVLTKILTSYPKTKLEDGSLEPFHRTVGKRRASHQNSEHELEVSFASSIGRIFLISLTTSWNSL